MELVEALPRFFPDVCLQDAMAFCGDREDIVSAFMTATASLLEKHDIDPAQIGRLGEFSGFMGHSVFVLS